MGKRVGTELTGRENLSYIPLPEIDRLLQLVADPHKKAELFADINRFNTLYMIMKAGSGHIGSSFSAMDMVSWLWLYGMQNPNERGALHADTYLSSKGHDVPGLYAILIALRKLPFDLLHQLRRMGGLPGHPDVQTPYIAANTGPLGMGISKARGMAVARRKQGKKGRFYVLTGDGELQEGQLWESLQPTVNGGFSEITVIVDHNKIQSDTWVADVSDLGDLEAKFRAFGFEVARINGHDMFAIAATLERMKAIKDRPQIIIADTVKGKGVAFMERVAADGYYKFHSGAPSLVDYKIASAEILTRIELRAGSAPALAHVEFPGRPASKAPERLVPAYAEELVRIARSNTRVIALDADLVLDTGLIPFKKELPAQYIQTGIAEQDMVSMAGGMALEGYIPVVHSFACFLTTRPNEQIYNNASEGKKIIYVGSLSGLLPAGPGHSHQSVRDISTLGSIPGLTLLEPSCEREARAAIRWAVEENPASTYIRLTSIPADINFSLPVSYTLEWGRGIEIRAGTDVAILAYGPVILTEAMQAANLLAGEGTSVAVYNLPWLNYVDEAWLTHVAKSVPLIVSIDNHYTTLGQGSLVGEALARAGIQTNFVHFGLDEPPQGGANTEVLQYHRLDSMSLVERIRAALH